MPLIEQFLSWSKVCNRLIGNMAYLLHKEFQILTFCETSQLAAIANPDIYERLHPIVFEKSKEALCTLLGKTDSK